MIIIEARIRCNPGKRDEFIKEVQPAITGTRGENGCLSYEVFMSTEDTDGIFIFERWDNRDAIKNHMETPHMKEWLKRRLDLGLISGPPTVASYDVANQS